MIFERSGQLSAFSKQKLAASQRLAGARRGAWRLTSLRHFTGDALRRG
jgi:hypothetical protein